MSKEATIITVNAKEKNITTFKEIIFVKRKLEDKFNI